MLVTIFFAIDTNSFMFFLQKVTASTNVAPALINVRL
ncbi:hypothetical protein STM14_4521 [Salmonella enterica subsp. enterica serovar Typhimurium str. 14028S]|uniref:Uncharacterized protein n=2 Tax=Salmonella enterica I TaxID=59201 RepID=A0A0F6B8Q6_SALT1|nr:hypothetical protein SPAB_04656 [Salmonella enterica subsp. enterica serovar Paratyphi B str. SPB7]ACY90904.1 hypothetical protein STM14_4521 [Salmonella enterica subsp. enterica serovar Typhimurium str. 14028S]